MIDLGFAVFLAIVSAGVGKRILDRLGSTPEHPLDALALALPLGMGVLSLATLGLGELGRLNRVGLSVVLGLMIEIGFMTWYRSLAARSWGSILRGGEHCRHRAFDRSLHGFGGVRHDADGRWPRDRRRRVVLPPSGAQSLSDAAVGWICARFA